MYYHPTTNLEKKNTYKKNFFQPILVSTSRKINPFEKNKPIPNYFLLKSYGEEEHRRRRWRRERHGGEKGDKGMRETVHGESG